MTFDSVVVVATPKCFVCGNTGTVEVPFANYLKRKEGALIQDAYPDMDKAEREQMVSGIHPMCWEAVYGKGLS